MDTSKSGPEGSRRIRLAYLVSHPIQYQAPLLRRIAAEPEIDLTVLFGSDFSVRGYSDKGFGGVAVKWDVPLAEGYKHEFLPALRDNATVGPFAPISSGILRRLRRGTGTSSDPKPFDVLWVHGYASVNALHGILAANALGIPVLPARGIHACRPLTQFLKLLAKQLFFLVLRRLVTAFSQSVPTTRAIGSTISAKTFRLSGCPTPLTTILPRTARSLLLKAAPPCNPNSASTPTVPSSSSPPSCRSGSAASISSRPTCSSRPEPSRIPYLLIVGDGEERAALEGRAAQSAAHGGIRFCGFRNQSELPRFFDCCTVFVLPSRHEPWGLIVNEVMNAARPVILSDDVGCQPDLVTDGVEGHVVPVGDVAALTAALRSILEVPGNAERMGQNALERITRWSFEEDLKGLRRAISVVTHHHVAD